MRTTVTLLALLTLAVPAVAQNSAPEGHIHPIELEKMLLDGKPIPTPPFLPGADPESLIDQATVFRGISAQQREGTEGILGGDLNGDGYDDIVTSFGSGTSSANRVYIRFGGPSISPSPDVTIQTDGTFSFGTELSDAGDLNGDGYADFFIGAFNNGAPGRGFVFFGRSAWPSVLSAATDADLILQPSGSTTSRFGWEADGVGDINADGHGDLVVGDFTGTAYVFFGGAAMDATPDLTLSGFSGLGYYVAGVGDLNQDGHPDFALGSTSAGALVYHGGPSLDATADLIVNVPGTTFMRVEGGGDVNGDGAPDLLMGTWSYDRPTLPDAGAVFVAYGGATMDNVVDVTIEGTQSGGDLGWTLSPLYDLDGDGYADILAGERDYNGALGLRQGRVSLYRGGPSMDGRPDAVFEGDEASDFFGQNAVSMGGDTDGDGYGEILVSATNFGSFGESRLYRIGFSGDDVADLNVRRSFEEGYGSSIAVIDANNDGYDDVVVGAYLDDTGADAAGAVRIYYGGPLYDAEHDVLLYATQANASFGWRVANAGDMNRDGYDDLLVSATGAGVSTGGQAYVFLGGPSLSGTLTTASAAVTLQPGGIGFESVDFGSEVATGGDFNGDGYADVVVADNQENDDTGSTTRFAQGAAYVFFGGATLNGAHDVKVTGRYYNDDVDGSNNAGSGLAMGDYNADGFTDVAVGASGVDGDDSGVTRQRVGFVGVLFGRSRSATDPALDFRLVNLSGLFGFSDDGLLGVSAATVDLNGDSIDDLAMGSFVDVNGNDDAGRLYLTYGSATDFDVRDYTLTSSGTGAFEYYSWTLAPGGDLNGDGYEDLLLGSYSYYDYDVYALYGGPRPDGQRDVRMPKPFGFFSRFALASGDINGDGLSDALTGDSYAYDNSASWADVSIYLSTPPALRPGLWVVRDVPGDQGGFVRLEWTRSGFDTAGGDIEEYRVYRAATPGPGGLAWEQIATVSPSALPRYAYTAATTSDQTPTNSGLFYFRVGAVIDRTFGQQDEVFYSLMRSGASADNLSPAAPATLALTQSPDGDVALTWDEVTGEPDLFGYDVFQSSTEACDATATLVGTAEGETTVTFEDDATAFGTEVFYCVAARDVHGNRSGVTPSASANPAILAAVKVVLEGAYDSGLPGGALMRTDLEDVLPLAHPFAGAPWNHTGTEAIDATDGDGNGRPDVLDDHAVVDWVLVGVRSATTASDAGRAAALLLSDGTLLDPATGEPYASVKPATAGAYHVVVYHRSHLSAMSVFAVGLAGDGPNAAFDFSLSPSLVFGGGVKELVPTVYGLYAGDGDGDGSVLAPDRQSVWLPLVGQVGYLVGDFNLDGSVLADDRQVLWLPNVGVQSTVPGAASLGPSDLPPSPPDANR